MELTSQKMRKLAPELDPLRLGTGWTPDELSKPQIIVESTFGDSHPGSGHLDKLVNAACKGAAEAGGHGARYFASDFCDGESQGTDGINFSLASREMIANMIEIHANATPFDGGVYISSCDKGMPANLMGLARVNIPSVVVTGGTMHAGPELLTLEQLGMYSAKYERGEIDEAKLNWAKQNACPSCGACSFIGTASTMQIMAEALGLALPGSALLPATSPDLVEYARRAGVIGWAPEAVLIFGSVNDSILGNTAEHVYDTASLLYAAINAALPTTRLLVVGPQSGSSATLVEAVIAAATDAGVLTVVDQIADEWMTPANPNWVYIGGMPSASGHPNPDGARRYAELMLPMFTQALIT